MVKKIDKEKMIIDFMRQTGQSRQNAEFAIAIELGEIKGDAEIVETFPVDDDDDGGDDE